MGSKKKKIVFLFPHLPNPRMIKRVKALMEVFEVKVIYWDRQTGNQIKNELPKEVDIYIINKKGNEGNPIARLGVTIKVMNEALKVIKKEKPEKLYISKTDMLFVGVFYKRLLRSNVDIIYEVSDIHSLLIDDQKSLLKKIFSKSLRKMEEYLCKGINLLVVTSEYFYSKYYSKFVPENNMLFIPNTPDPTVFEGFKREKRDKFTVGFIGTVRYPQQIKMLIDVADELSINVFIAGDGVSYSEISEYAIGKDHVTLYGGYEYEKEIKSLYERIDCVYSVYDTSKKNVRIALPNRLYEAVYTNTPLIVSQDTYLGDLVIKYGIGKVVNSKDSIDLKNKLIELSNSQKNKQVYDDLARNWSLPFYNQMLVDKLEK